MREWLVAGTCLAVGVGVGTRWPRRRRFSITTRPRWGWGVSSVIPCGARPMPGNDECVEGGHDGVAWAERVVRFPWWKPWEGRRTEITGATCGECGCPQSQLRVVYPPGYTVRLQAFGPDHRPAPGEPAGPVPGAGRGGR